MNVAEMDKHLDFWSVMGYDFAGTFSSVTQHASNLFPTGDINSAFSVSAGVEAYIAAGVNPRKLNIGMPIYAHGFLATDGFGSSFVKPDENHGDWKQPGFYDYNTLVDKWIPDGELFEDEKIGASWLYSKKSRNLFSFDSPKIVNQKAKWVVERGLGGLMWWQLNADKFGDWRDNLVETGVRVMNRDNFDRSMNHINYPNSKWPNIATCDNVPVVPVHPSLMNQV
ncbi:Chitotriosidase-1 [Arthrobotrys entomopaga]|nr:Chitotriosidase-1 [Arthrobotrys entomopaga]